MGLESDITINVAKFQKESISASTDKFNDQLMDIMSKGPKWYEVCHSQLFLLKCRC
jgi:hypothetical protein